MKKKKIGIFMDTFFPYVDGVVMVVDNYAKRLAKIADVVVVTAASSDKNYIDDKTYRVIRIKSINFPLINQRLAVPIFEKNLMKNLLAEEFDIIHIHSPFTIGKLGVKIAKKQNIPVVGTMHTQFKLEFLRYTKSEFMSNQLLKPTLKTFNACDECWAVNSKIADVFVEYGYKKRPLITDNGTEMNLVTNASVTNKYIDEKYDIKKNEYMFLFVGRINILKNIIFIVEVMHYLKKYKLNFKMLFVGSGPDEKILRDKIYECDLNEEVKLLGQICDREELEKIYQRATLFVFPSLFDASSLVQVEAASQKTPTIFIENSATSNTVMNNHNGFTAPADPEIFALRIRAILKDKKLYNKVCQNAYEEVYKSWDLIADDAFKRYCKLIEEKKSTQTK